MSATPITPKITPRSYHRTCGCGHRFSTELGMYDCPHCDGALGPAIILDLRTDPVLLEAAAEAMCNTDTFKRAQQAIRDVEADARDGCNRALLTEGVDTLQPEVDRARARFYRRHAWAEHVPEGESTPPDEWGPLALFCAGWIGFMLGLIFAVALHMGLLDRMGVVLWP